MSQRRIKARQASQKYTNPIKDKKDINNLLKNLKSKYEHARSPQKKYQADRNWMLVLVALNTAFRAEDLIQLRVEDLEKGYIHIKESKTGKVQNFPMNKQFKKEVLDYIERNGLTSSDYMFLGQQKKQGGEPYCNPITKQQARNFINKACKEVGIKKRVGLHGLRKTFGYQYIARGGNPETLRKMFNHSDVSVTERYIMWNTTDAENDRKDIYIG